jgi:hypothetical protein
VREVEGDSSSRHPRETGRVKRGVLG